MNTIFEHPKDKSGDNIEQRIKEVNAQSPTPKEQEDKPEERTKEKERNHQMIKKMLSFHEIEGSSPQPSGAEKSKTEPIYLTYDGVRRAVEFRYQGTNMSAGEINEMIAREYASQEVRKALQEQTELRWSDEDMVSFFAWCQDNEIEWNTESDNWLIAGTQAPIPGKNAFTQHYDPLTDRQLIAEWVKSKTSKP